MEFIIGCSLKRGIDQMAVATYRQYQGLARVDSLQAGDILIKKVFPETAKNAVEKGITLGQRLFQKDEVIKISTGGVFSRSEKHSFPMLGSNTSEHAAIAIAPDVLAEAVGEGVITASIWGRMEERYIVYRCPVNEVRLAAINIATGLSNAYRNTVTGQSRSTTGGAYSLGGAIKSNFRATTFNQHGTNDYLQHIIDFVHGLRPDRPDMFCSEFAMACYEAGSVAARGKTAFGTNPKAMSPMQMEAVLNARPDMVKLLGKFDSENNPLYHGVETALNEYKKGLSGFFRNQSDASKAAFTALSELLLIGNMEYLYAAILAYMNTQGTYPPGVELKITPAQRLSPSSTLYGLLKKHLATLIKAR